MKPIPRDVVDAARRQRGLVTAAQLCSGRVVGRQRTDALRSGLIVAVHRGVYRFATHEVTFEQRCLAALLAAPSAVISGPTAARLQGLRRVTSDDVHIISRHTVALEGVHPHKTDLLGPDDHRVIDGIRVLAAGRLICDLAWHLDNASLESVFEQMLQRNMLSISAARAHARRFRRKGRPGSRRLGRMLDSRAEWLKPADSDLELQLWHGLRTRGIVAERQVAVRLDSGRTVRLDLAVPGLRYAIEVDHVTWHGGRLEMQADKRRDRELARLGWLASRVTDEDIQHRLAATLDELVAIIHQRRQAAA